MAIELEGIPREYAKGIGEAVANRTINRTNPDGTRETWADVCQRVASGNTDLADGSMEEFLGLREHMQDGTILLSGRHLQHGDGTQDGSGIERFTNCSTSCLSSVQFLLLLNGSGVGRSYDNHLIKVDWANCPYVICEVSEEHADMKSGLIGAKYLPIESTLLKKNTFRHKVEDSREGWARCIELLESFAWRSAKDTTVVFDFSDVRPSGSPIGGMQNRPASGPLPLIEAIDKLATLRGSTLPAWHNAMLVDHYLAECVLVGGARRAARMSVKHWSDSGIFDFIRIKQSGDLWTSNNSVGVDAEFWAGAKSRPTHSEPLYYEKARAVFKAIVDSQYDHGTGEPGLVNIDQLNYEKAGVDSHREGDMLNEDVYKPMEMTKELLADIFYAADNHANSPMIVNPCVAGYTEILTDEGYLRIGDVVGQKVNVWNGYKFSEVEPFSTGDNKTVCVELSNGASLDCTEYHKFVLDNGRKQVDGVMQRAELRVEAKDLKIGDKLFKYSMPVIGKNSEDVNKEAYSQGFYSGDGSTDMKRSYLYEPKYMCEEYLIGTLSTKDETNKRKTWQHGEMLPKDYVPLDADMNYRMSWLAGLLDADGCVIRDKRSDEYKSGAAYTIQLFSIDREFLDKLQLMLTTLGCQAHIGVGGEAGMKEMPDGRGGLAEYHCKDIFRISLNTSDTATLLDNGLDTLRLNFDGNVSAQRDARRFVTVTNVSPAWTQETFCFNEPENHTGTFNGIVTGQCGEIPLAIWGAYCVIGDVAPLHGKDQTDIRSAIRHTVRALMRTNTMPALYQKEVERTNRIGVSLTGIHEYAYQAFGLTWHDMLDEKGKAKEFWDAIGIFSRDAVIEAIEYARELGVNAPHTVTTIKPAGTTSKLFGLSEGAHLPAMREYIRWVQFKNDDPLVAEYTEKGYPTRELKVYSGMTIVGFPTRPAICNMMGSENVVTASEATPEEQYKYLMLLEKHWLSGAYTHQEGNQISYTLKYKPNQVGKEEYTRLLLEYQPKIKCCSIMPDLDGSGVYEYLPEEPISPEVYDTMMSNIKSDEIQEDIGAEHVECAGGACPIDFNTNN